MHGYTIIKANPNSKHKNPNTTKCLYIYIYKNSLETIAPTNALTTIVVQYITLTNPTNYINEIAFELKQSFVTKLVWQNSVGIYILNDSTNLRYVLEGLLRDFLLYC